MGKIQSSPANQVAHILCANNKHLFQVLNWSYLLEKFR